MAEPSAYVTDVIIDCSYPERVANFWASLLGWPIAGRKGRSPRPAAETRMLGDHQRYSA
jgi:hypothetical protein